MDTQAFSVRLDASGDVACVDVAGDLDLATVGQLCSAISLALQASHFTELAVDLAGVTFCDSTGLEAMINAQRSCQERQVAFTLRQPDRRLREILKITGLDNYFTIEP